MSRYYLSPLARNDLNEIHDYIANDNPRAARRFVLSLKETCQLLARNPELGERKDDLAPSLRCFVVGNYVIFYQRVDRDVEIVRFISGVRDIEALFRTDTGGPID